MMTFKEFCEQFDKPDSVCLLFGKRIVLPEDEKGISEVAEMLGQHTKYLKFRSGNAPGADTLFAFGIAAKSPERIHLIIPYTGHRKASYGNSRVTALEELSVSSEPEVQYLTKFVKPQQQKLIERYYAGKRDPYTMKAAYWIRDIILVIGHGKMQPSASVALVYDNLDSPGSGGTGFTMNICSQKGIPYLDQRVWKQWILSV